MAKARSKAFHLLLALAFPAALVAPLALAAEPPAKPAKPAGEKKYDPENVTAISRYMETVVKGTELFKDKDTTGAIDTYKKAVQLNPRHPAAYLLLSDAYLSTGNVGEAEAAIEQAYEGDTKDALLRAHVLFVRADLLERQKKLAEAKTAWQAYTEHAAKLGDAGVSLQTGAERVKAIQKVLEMEKAYAAVRERIAAEKAAAAASASAKPAAPKK